MACGWSVCGIHAATGALHQFRDASPDRFASEPLDVRDVKAVDGAFAGDRRGGLWDVENEERIAVFDVGIERVMAFDDRAERPLVRLRDGRVAVSAAAAFWLEGTGLELEPGPDGWHFVAAWRGAALSAGIRLLCWDHAGLGRCVTEVYDGANHTHETRLVDVPLAAPIVLDGLVCSRGTGGRVSCTAIAVVDGAATSPAPLTIDLSRW